jgi:Ni2+-binding GTPase involved in maturation of urease and hydrogenase
VNGYENPNFSVERIRADMKRLAPDAAVFLVSALKGDGIPAAADWLAGRVGDRPR